MTVTMPAHSFAQPRPEVPLAALRPTFPVVGGGEASSDDVVDQSDLPVLAELPDLDGEPATAAVAPPRSPGRRLISQPLSASLLLGGGTLLALAAIVSFTVARQPPTTLPTDGSATWQPVTESGPSEATPTPPKPTAATPAPEHTPRSDAPPPAFPAFPSPTVDQRDRTPVAVPTFTAPPMTAPAEAPPATPFGNRAPARTAPGVDESRLQGRTNQPMSLWPATTAPAVAPPLAERQMSVPPSPTTTAEATYLPPGTARLEGVIEQPSLRTTYDGSRSSIH